MAWCNFSTDFYEIRGEDRSELGMAVGSIIALRKKGFALQKRIKSGADGEFLVMKCRHDLDGSAEREMNEHSCMPLYPYAFEKGWAKIRAVAFDERRLGPMFSKLSRFGDIEIEEKRKVDPDSMRDLFIVPTSTLAAGLTEKQGRALLLAAELGYYNVPRKVRFEDIAKSLRVPRTTYEEHVRKAECKIVNSLVPYLSIYFGRSRE